MLTVIICALALGLTAGALLLIPRWRGERALAAEQAGSLDADRADAIVGDYLAEHREEFRAAMDAATAHVEAFTLALTEAGLSTTYARLASARLARAMAEIR